MKRIILVFVCSWVALGAFAQNVDLDSLKKEIRILEKIIKTSMESEGRDHQSISPHDINAVYLANQGVVLTIGVGAGGGLFGDYLQFAPHGWATDIEMPEPPEIADVQAIGGDGGDERFFQLSEQVEMATEQAAMALEDASMALAGRPFGQESPELRALREEKMKASKEIREKQRELKQQLSKGREMSDKDRDKLREEIKAYSEKIKAISTAYAEKAKAIRAKQDAEWQQKLVGFEDQLLAALCEFGGSLKSLPRDQYLSVVLKSADRSGSEGPRDKVFVFKKADLLACRNGDMTAAALKSKSGGYGF